VLHRLAGCGTERGKRGEEDKKRGRRRKKREAVKAMFENGRTNSDCRVQDDAVTVGREGKGEEARRADFEWEDGGGEQVDGDGSRTPSRRRRVS
jgi:hypothetical protein